MKILFIHQNFPGQFLHLAPAMVKQGHEVHALVMKKEAPTDWAGVRVHAYQPTKGSTQGVHPWALDLETKIIRAESVFRKCRMNASRQSHEAASDGASKLLGKPPRSQSVCRSAKRGAASLASKGERSTRDKRPARDWDCLSNLKEAEPRIKNRPGRRS